MFSYSDVQRRVSSSGSLPPQEAANEFDPRPFRRVVYDLSIEGLPYLPAVSHVSLGQYDPRSPWHQHKGCVEFVFCRRGVMQYEAADHTYNVRLGFVFVSRPGEFHRQIAEGRRLLYSSLKVSTKQKDWLRSGFSVQEYRWAMESVKALPRCFSCGSAVEQSLNQFFKIIQADRDRIPGKMFRLRLSASRLFMDVLDAVNQTPGPGRSAITELVAEIEAHPERRIGLEELVGRLSLSPSGVLKAFKRQTGFSPHAYQLKCCAERGKELLARGETVEYAAVRLGFTSRQHFASTFRRYVGMSPREWMKKHIKQ